MILRYLTFPNRRFPGFEADSTQADEHDMQLRGGERCFSKDAPVLQLVHEHREIQGRGSGAILIAPG